MHIYMYYWFSRDVIKIKKYEYLPFKILVELFIRTAEDLSFYKCSV